MGYSYDWLCTQCRRKYTKLAGKGSGIMVGVTYPYYCIHCFHLHDYIIFSSTDYFTKINPEKCHKCRKQGGLKEWNIVNKPCTTQGCNGHLEIDPKGCTYLLD